MELSDAATHLAVRQQMRTRVLNGELEQTFRDWHPGFRSAGTESLNKAASPPLVLHALQNLWKRLTREDFRGLTPLFYAHINPYGTFNLDLTRPSFLGAV